MTIAADFASYTENLSFSDLPPSTIAVTKRVILDSLGCAIGAFTAGCPPARILEESLDDIGGPAESTVIGSGTRTSALSALLINSTLVRYLDLNDAYGVVTPKGMAGGHPSDALGAILAVAERQRTSGHDVITNIVLAYELFAQLTAG